MLTEPQRRLIMAPLDDATDLGREAVGPGRFDEDLAGVAIAGLRDATKSAGSAGAVFAVRHAQLGHELARVLETGQFADFGDQADGDGELHAAQGLDRLRHRIKPPCGSGFAQRRLQAFTARHAFIDGASVFLEGDL